MVDRWWLWTTGYHNHKWGWGEPVSPRARRPLAVQDGGPQVLVDLTRAMPSHWHADLYKMAAWLSTIPGFGAHGPPFLTFRPFRERRMVMFHLTTLTEVLSSR